jgi:phage protein D
MLTPIFELFYEQKNITQDVSPYVTSIEYSWFKDYSER